MVGQFIGDGPPIKVIRSVANWLWGYEGKVEVFQISSGFFLFEFTSVNLRDWVVQRSWHIHREPMIVRNYPGVEPANFAKELKPVWVEFRGVPPELLTPEGVSWLATQLGKPVNKLVRNRFNVQVCVLRKELDDRFSELKVEMIEGKQAVIQINFLEGRVYKKTGPSRVYQQKVVAASSSNEGNASASPSGEKDAPASG
ncbi:hypothetical protein LINPERPRIM_LOCUS38276 [Linum perenne]